MVSNVCEIKKGGEGLSEILREVEKAAAYNELDKKQTLRLRLLAEELTGMLPELVRNFEGRFWVENSGMAYELHVELLADEMDMNTKENLLAVSKSKKNAAASGFMGKVREMAEDMALYGGEAYSCDPSGFENWYSVAGSGYVAQWSLAHYRQQQSGAAKKDEWDELESSIVGKLSDDVIVGIRGNRVDIVIKKAF